MTLYIKNLPEKGRGVFSTEPIKRGQMIETAPAIIIPSEQIESLDRTELRNYWLKWNGDQAAIGCGLISMYNHDNNPNAEFLLFAFETCIIVNAICDIEANEEICVNYHNPERFQF